MAQNPGDADRFPADGIGVLLRPLLEGRSSRPWREVVREATGEDLDSSAMAERFEPVLRWLREEHEGRRRARPTTRA